MKTIVITGATSGIGLETAKLLAQSGFQIIGIGRSAAHCAEAKKAICAAAPQSCSRRYFRTAGLYGAARQRI